MTRFPRSLLALTVAVVLAAAACAAPPAPPADDAPQDVAAVNAVRAAFMAGYAAGDAQAIAELYAEDAISEPNQTPTLVGRQAILESLQAMFENVSLKAELTPDETRTFGGTMGFDRGHYTVTVAPKDGGPETTAEGRYLVLLVKDTDGQWRVARDIDNVGAPTTPADAPMAETPDARTE